MTGTHTIAALATPPGMGAIAVVRLSGPDAISIADAVFRSVRNKKLQKQPSHTVHLGHLYDDQTMVDEVLVTVFHGPHSYTGEDVVEISCHGSTYIQQKLLQIVMNKGAKMAEAGEFTLRAFLNGKMDLTQAEAVADLIASEGAAAHRMAIQQMRGGISDRLSELRAQLVDFASLIELELDFSEEDVAFADRAALEKLLDNIQETLKSLIDSFALGNAMKNGVPVAIAGKPNAGKSSLLNALLQEEKAIVSDIPGTTRDSIEDTLFLNGIQFRFIDTAGLRETDDRIEAIGVERAKDKIAQSQLLLYVVDPTQTRPEEVNNAINELQTENLQTLVIINKVDLLSNADQNKYSNNLGKQTHLFISAQTQLGLKELKQQLSDLVQGETFETIITNNRHYATLKDALEATLAVRKGLSDGLSSDLLAIDLRATLDHLGTVTGTVSTDELLGNIFANFCIGK
ncbi:MAG: tRNA uridine-5-carboxymethylaminomethyl(34) synthesis GTPase MnmE [Flavobacteriaceae bacterium]|nr:tRNA uridine-5-carboxymethylaminomethyl(34) synthesis GTPase MnmE [Flavobacteriaceae bacterium]